MDQLLHHAQCHLSEPLAQALHTHVCERQAKEPGLKRETIVRELLVKGLGKKSEAKTKKQQAADDDQA